MKNVTIIELSCHAVYLRTLARAATATDIQLTLVLAHKSYGQLVSDSSISDLGAQFLIVNLSDNRSVRNARRRISISDTILINTVVPQVFHLLEPSDYSKCIVTIHNAISETARLPFWMACPLWLRIRAVFSNLRFSSPSVRQRIWSAARIPDQRLRLFNDARHILVFHQNMVPIIVARTNASPHRISTVPFNLPVSIQTSPTVPSQPNHLGYIGLGIIGNISFKRKNFSAIFRILNRFATSLPVRLTIIGRFVSVKDERYLSQLIENSRCAVHLVGGTHRVPTSVVADAMQHIHFLVGLQTDSIRINCVTEQYGYSKASGVEFDALSFNRVLLRPECISATRGMESLSVAYTNHDHFIQILEELSNRTRYEDLYATFSKSRVRVFDSLFKTLKENVMR